MTYHKPFPESIAVIGNYLPRKCGIATFTTDLANALVVAKPGPKNVIVVAVNDVPEGYAYPDRVKFEIRDKVPADYLRAADFLNINKVDIAILEHEYGIYGGQNGAHIFYLIEHLRMPIITTLHTVLADPDDDQKAILIRISKISEQLLVMSQKAKELLLKVYGIPEKKITIIPHGIPDVPFIDPSFYKNQFGVENRKVILTFGLLGPGKGLEYIIDAMPAIVNKHPDSICVILGATHPQIIRTAGEEYRHSLQQRVRNLGMKKYVLFYNEFLDSKTLTQFLTAADIYVSPYLSQDQIVSGTLSYALGVGKAVISTPYWYALELLADKRGIVVPFKDPNALAKAADKLLSSEALRNSMRKRAYEYSRPMIWKEVARDYLKTAHQAIKCRLQTPSDYHIKLKPMKPYALPKIRLHHLNIMTDDTGLFQHAFFSIPNREHGYCLDDNARALIFACRYYQLRGDENILSSLKKYLSFIISAFNQKNGKFRNFMSYDRRWLEESGSEDSHGRAMWALGVAIQAAPDLSIRDASSQLFVHASGCMDKFTSPRALAFVLIGIYHYLKVYGGDADIKKARELLVEKLYGFFPKNASTDWPWPEDILAYSNAVMPHALILTGHSLADTDMLDAGLRSLQWLLKQETHEAGHISIIGNDGWMRRNKERAHFDQQPVEAMTLMEACVTAYRITSDKFWRQEARRCIDWFMGTNDLAVLMVDFKTGGCHDGLQPNGVNGNMGAESTLAWLISLLDMEEVITHEILLNTNKPAGDEIIANGQTKKRRKLKVE